MLRLAVLPALAAIGVLHREQETRKEAWVIFGLISAFEMAMLYAKAWGYI